MNSHERLQSDLLDLVHRELSPWRALHVRLHLAHCADCRAEKKRLETLWRSLRSLRTPSTTPTRLRLKGKPMQARVLLAAFSASFCALGGTLIHRAQQPKFTSSTSRILGRFGKFAWAEGNSRGTLIFEQPGQAPPSEWAQEGDTLTLIGDGSSNRATVGIALNSDPAVGKEALARFDIALGESHEVRNAQGRLVAIVKFIPLTPEQEQTLRQEAQEDEKRFTALYTNPASFSLDSGQAGGAGYFASRGMVTWMQDVLRDDTGTMVLRRINGQKRGTPLESGGFAWKVLGEAQVTMSLYTDKAYQPLIRHYKSQPLPRLGQSQSELSEGTLPKSGAPPRIYWSQAMPATPSSPEGIRKQGNYWMNENGGWQTVARSGEFTGYGKHIVNGPDGNPQLILEVSPL